MTRVIGLISGTSVDGIDAALVDITGQELDLKVQLLAAATYPYPAAMRSRILDLCSGEPISIPELAELDDAIAEQFALAAVAIQTDNAPAELIGSHGQTVYHRPPIQKGEGKREKGEVKNSALTSHFSLPTSPSPLGYSLQLGRGAAIAHLSNITTVSNFRAADIAAGGQGAPLVSRVDAYLLSHPQECRCVQNIGGIGNLTYLPAKGAIAADGTVWPESVRGWDTGPGNVLLDLAVQHITGNAQTYDKDGAGAANGTPSLALVERWLQHPFFHQPPPKSTGRELFGQEFLQQCLADAGADSLSPGDLLATLTEFTVAAIAHSYHTFLPQLPDTVLLCGGGSRNLYLKRRLQVQLESVRVLTTDEVGLNADFKEAIAFAVLAYWRQLGIPGNLPHVTGANQPLLLGDIHRSRKR